MLNIKSRVLTLALAGLMVGQAILPVSAAENTDPAQSKENAEAGIMLIDETGTDAGETEETADTDTAEAETIDTSKVETETTKTDTAHVTATETAAEDNVEEAEEIQVLSVDENTEETSDDTDGGISPLSDSKTPILFTGGKTGTHDTIKTVDSTALGVKMYMYNFPVSDEYYTENFLNSMGDGSSRIFKDDGDDEDPANDLGIVRSMLGEDGYPILASTGQSLKTWFDTGTDTYNATQANHLFSQAEYDKTGYLSFDCLQNYAYFDQSTGNFKVYEDVGVPYWGYAVEEDGTIKTNEGGNNRVYSHMEHGQFFPYDDLTDFAEPNFRQTYNINGGALAEDDPLYGRTLYRSTGYTFHFGMQINADFIQPIDGMVTANGNAENMRYEFSGDDDLWVFIDDVLVLDIGGIHGARSGYIDFATGEVYQAAVDQRTTIKALFEDAGAANKVEWNGNTFADYSEHSFKMFYMERGENCGGLQVRMNLITIPENHAGKQVYDASGKEINGQAIEIGDELTYKITAENPASVTKDVVVTDILPDGVEFISADNGGTCADGKVTWTLPMTAGSRKEVTFKVRIKDEAVGTIISNEAIEEIGKIALKTNEVTNPVNNRYQITTEVVGGTITTPVGNIRKGTDQQISYSPKDGYIMDSVTVDGDTVDSAQFEDAYTFENITANHTIKVVYARVETPVKLVCNENGEDINGGVLTAGETVSYRVTVENPTSTAKEFTITDQVPDGVKFVSAANNGSYSNGVVTWRQTVEANSELTVSYKAQVNDSAKGHAVSNVAKTTVGGVTCATNEVENYILTEPVKAVRQGTANVVGQYITDGEEITYTITVSNPSDGRQDITVTDTVSNALEIKKVSDDGKIDGHKITWTLKDVAAHTTKTVSVTAAAIGTDKEQTVDNTAQMTLDGHTLTSNNVRILIPVKPTVTIKETTVTNKTVNNETENNVLENNKTITNDAKDVGEAPATETSDTAATTANGAVITGYRNVNTGDMARTGLLLAIAGAAAVGLGVYYYKRRH